MAICKEISFRTRGLVCVSHRNDFDQIKENFHMITFTLNADQ